MFVFSARNCERKSFVKMYFVRNFVLVLILSSVNVYCLDGFNSKPQILNDPEIILDANTNYSLFCQGNEPLKWTLPDVENTYKDWTKFREVEDTPNSTLYKYGLRLMISNISFPFVGYYYCHFKNLAKDSHPGSEKVYLFVNDTQHLSVLEGEIVRDIVVTQREVAVIPCRPTSPDISVTLTNIIYDKVSGAIYNSKTGFSFTVTDLSQQSIYSCSFTRSSDESEDVLYNLIVKPYSPVSFLPIPSIEEVTYSHVTEGDNITLRCYVKTPNSISFEWQTPYGSIDENRINVTRLQDSSLEISQFTVVQAKKEESGTYTCTISDYQNHKNNASIEIKIFGKEDNFLIIEEANNVYHTVTAAGTDSVQWVVDVDGHPKVTVYWIKKDGNDEEKIPMGEGKKYTAQYNEKSKKAILVIKHVTIRDMMTYVLMATNGITEKKENFFLNVTDKPTAYIEAKPFYKIGKIGTVKCEVSGNPPPEISWKYKGCSIDESCEYQMLKGNITNKGAVFISEVNILANVTGAVVCTAVNINGTDEAESGFYVSDVENGFDIFGFDETVVVDENKTFATVAIGEPISMTCGASLYNYTNIAWFFNGKVLADRNHYSVETSHTVLSDRLKLEIPQTNESDRGQYSCRVGSTNGKFVYKNITLRITDPIKPYINKTNLKPENDLIMSLGFKMYCKAYGVPKPKLTWYKDGIEFHPTESRIHISEDNEQIKFNSTDIKDAGEYKCVAENKKGSDSKQQLVRFKNAPKSPVWLIVIIVILSLLFFIAVVFIIIKVKKERDLRIELKKIGLTHFEEGEVESINPNLGVDEQAELLPYDKKWEFPIERLKLGKQLGSGAFGVVMKGEAKNIVEGESLTTVAVKMVKKNADHTYIKALASELKVMVHLGKHLNVVNLLGACTKNVAKRELLVIVEFCRFGNIQNYLIRHRNDFINQVDHKTGNLDYTIGHEQLDRTYSVSSNHSNPHSPMLKYAALVFSNSSQNQLPPTNGMGDYRGNNSDNSANTQMTTVPQGEDGEMLSNNSIQPQWRTNYRGDYKGHVKPISTKDLLAWSFQVARGMEYLASRKVLHGDLAARNILLSDNNIVKICDFGLAKSMYKSDNYKKSGNCPLPVKWMAIESIRDRVFSTQSDVWSFGIVLWELFSLARTPYPGMEADERLYHKLVEGYRMESPEYAPKQIYQMMTECWSVKPLARPTFTKLSERLGNLIEDSLRQHYIDLNDPYLKMNTKRIEEGKSDYLAMLSPPTFEVLSSPQYVNDDVIVSPVDQSDGYLSMQPNMIFSPRLTEEEIFDFNVNNRKNINSENGKNCELLPMLNTINESDSETPLPSPFPQGDSVSNPSYHHLPTPIREEDPNAENCDNIVKNSDNYINMSRNKNNFKDKIANNSNANPFVEVNNKKQEAHYVNDDTRDWGRVQV